jgi:hypothetical protein
MEKKKVNRFSVDYSLSGEITYIYIKLFLKSVKSQIS